MVTTAGKKLGKPLQQPVGNHIDIIDDARNQVAMRPAIDHLQRRPLQLIKNIDPQVANRTVSDGIGTKAH